MPFIFIPNAFTPNNDGINDVFLPSVNGPITRARLDVFDRWGELIFSTENTAAGWNGESNGTAVQDAVYSWTLTYKAVTSEGVQQEFLTGHVTLLR
jgi:gliding motility-associated-like protein